VAPSWAGRRALAPSAVKTFGGWPAICAVVLAVTVLSWRNKPWRVAGTGLNSWQEGLALGYQHHLQWGPQVLFTFGPFGFVEDVMPFFRATAAIALLYALAVTAGLAALVVLALRPSWGLLPAGVAAWAAVTIAANLVEAPQLALATALGLSLAAVRAEHRRARWALLACLGALSGFQLLVEISAGLVSVGLLAVAILAGRGRRLPAAGAALAPFVTVPVAALAAGGQSLSNFPSYLRGSLDIATGYGSAMGLSAGRTAEDWYAVADLAVVVMVYVLALRRRPDWERVAAGVALAGWCWAAVKEGFVRHDMHDLTLFGLLLVAICLVPLRRAHVPAQAGAVVLAAVIACVANAGVPAPLT
jgi:hypothetical protein